MKYTKSLIIFSLLMISALTTSCTRTRDDIWEDSKSAGRHVGRGVRALGGKHGESRQVASRDEFAPYNDTAFAANDDFIPLMNDEQQDVAMADIHSMQPAESPGDLGSSIPGIDAFINPANESGLAQIFKHIRFPYNSNLVKGRDNFMIVSRIADFMKKNPKTYIFVEGHCDERGSESYNLALGSRRANAIRNLLISEGVDPDHLFTISYGKERPTALGNNEESWSLNRRAEFKIWSKS